MKETLDVKLDPDKVYKAIATGVESAISQMINSGTAMPCRDFFDAVEKGAKEAFGKVAVRAGPHDKP